MKLRPVLVLLALLAFAAGSARAQTGGLAEADRLRETGRFKEAVALLGKMQSAAPNNAEVLWRLARAKVDLGETTTARKDQDALYQGALADANAAVKAGPNNAQAHLARAIAAGRVGLNSGTKQKVNLSRDVKESVDQAIKLDPKEATAYHVRGRWNYEVAGLGFVERAAVKVAYGGLPNASFEQAAKDFQRAGQLDDRVINHLELGKTYLKLGDKAKARTELQKAAAMPNGDPDDPMHKREAQELLRKL